MNAMSINNHNRKAFYFDLHFYGTLGTMQQFSAITTQTVLSRTPWSSVSVNNKWIMLLQLVKLQVSCQVKKHVLKIPTQITQNTFIFATLLIYVAKWNVHEWKCATCSFCLLQFDYRVPVNLLSILICDRQIDLY